jgi:type II secretory pathway pseudopilin PulG
MHRDGDVSSHDQPDRLAFHARTEAVMNLVKPASLDRPRFIAQPMLIARPRRTLSRRGFFLIDAIFALGIILLLAGLLTVAMTRQQRATTHFGDARDALRLAERTLTAIQIDQPPPAPPAGSTIEIRPLESATKSPGLRWVSVHVLQHRRSVVLVGIAPSAPPAIPTSTSQPASAPASAPAPAHVATAPAHVATAPAPGATAPAHRATAPATTQGAHP